MLSKELQMGKAGEHLACCDLIAKGYNAFLSDQGLPYDVIVDAGERLLKIQVKTTGGKVHVPKSGHVYRFGLRHGKKSKKMIPSLSIDYVAFVFMDRRSVDYLPVELLVRDGVLKQCLEFKDTGNSKYRVGSFPLLKELPLGDFRSDC